MQVLLWVAYLEDRLAYVERELGRVRQELTKVCEDIRWLIDKVANKVIDKEHTKKQKDTPFNPPKGKRQKRNLQVFEKGTVEYRLASMLRSKILQNNEDARGPKLTPDALFSWCQTIHKMIHNGLDPMEIGEVIYWCQADHFWRAHILTAGKLNNKYDTLKLLMQGDSNWDHETWERKPVRRIKGYESPYLDKGGRPGGRTYDSPSLYK
jgi:hypothetical protein